MVIKQWPNQTLLQRVWLKNAAKGVICYTLCVRLHLSHLTSNSPMSFAYSPLRHTFAVAPRCTRETFDDATFEGYEPKQGPDEHGRVREL